MLAFLQFSEDLAVMACHRKLSNEFLVSLFVPKWTGPQFQKLQKCTVTEQSSRGTANCVECDTLSRDTRLLCEHNAQTENLR